MSATARRFTFSALLICSTAPGTTPALATRTVPASTELVVPRPDLGAMQKTPRARIETLQESIEKALAAGRHDTREVLEGFGFLGLLYHSAQMLDAAEICYLNARSLAPEDGRWSYYLALVRHSKGDLAGAVQSYEDSIRREPDRAATRLRLGEVLLELGRGEEARAHFEAAEQTGPSAAAALFGLGRVAVLEGDQQRAVELFEGVLAEQPDADAVRYPLGQALRELGRTEEAEGHLALRGDRKVAFPDPLADVLVLTGKSSALQVIGDLAAADDFSEESFRGFVLSQFGEVVGAAAQVEKMLASLEESGSATPVQLGRVHYAAGILLAGQGEDDPAIVHFESAVEGDGELRDAQVKLGNALARGSRFSEAATRYDRALEMRPDDPDVLAKRAAARVADGRLEEATADFERALELATPERRTAVHRQLGDLHYGAGDLDRSARQYLEALRIDEGYVPALERLAAVLGQLRQYDAAAHTYGRWIAREPDNVEARVGEATALILGGRFAAATERLEAGLAAMPGQLDLEDILARHLAASPDPSVRDGGRALELAEELYRKIPTLQSLETLAMAHAQVGAFDQAVAWQTRLLEGADDDVPAAQLDLWRRNLERYRAGTPCCAAPNP